MRTIGKRIYLSEDGFLADATNAIKSFLNDGVFYPLMDKSDFSDELLLNMEDAERYMSCPEDKAKESKRRGHVATLWKMIANIIEDRRIQGSSSINVSLVNDEENDASHAFLVLWTTLRVMLEEHAYESDEDVCVHFLQKLAG